MLQHMNLYLEQQLEHAHEWLAPVWGHSQLSVPTLDNMVTQSVTEPELTFSGPEHPNLPFRAWNDLFRVQLAIPSPKLSFPGPNLFSETEITSSGSWVIFRARNDFFRIRSSEITSSAPHWLATPSQYSSVHTTSIPLQHTSARLLSAFIFLPLLPLPLLGPLP